MEKKDTLDVVLLWGQLSGASYYGFDFREILRKDPEARESALKLVERLMAYGCRGME